MDIYEKIASLLESANGCTGAGDGDLTSAIRTLIAGYVDNSLVLDDVVEWYKTEVSDAYRYVKSLGSGYVHHLCLADMHYNQNYRHSADIVKALQNTGRFGKVFLLGDNTDRNGVAEQITALEEDFGDLNGQICLICGNHDSEATNKSAYASMMSEDTDMVYGDENYLYYYFDDNNRKIRYIFINSYSGSTAITAQVNWFNGLVDNLPEGYGVIAFSHYAFTECYDMNGNKMTATDGTTTNSGFINKLANKRISDGGESVIAVLHGHYHWPDFTRFLGIQQIGLATDANSLKASPKVAGTNTEQSILILSVNTSKHTVKTKVIGWVPNEYYRALDINYAAPVTEWVYGYYLGGGSSFMTATDGALLPQVIPLNGADSLWVWNDLYKNGGYYYDQRADGEVLSNSRTTVDSNAHSRGVVQLEKGSRFPSANGFLLSTRIWGATDASEWEHIHWSTVAPVFTDWNDIVWLKDYYITNNSYTAQTGYAVLDKMISVSPGQTVSFSVDDENWTTNRIYFYLHSGPRHKKFTGTRIGVTNGQTSFTTTIPNGIHYLLIDAANLADYTDKAVVTITDPS